MQKYKFYPSVVYISSTVASININTVTAVFYCQFSVKSYVYEI